jgi:hypothetical protein
MLKMSHAQKPINLAPGGGFVKRKFLRRAAGVLLLAPLAAGPATARPQEATFDTSPYARVLESYVTPGGEVRYAELKRNPAELDAFLRQLAAISPENRPELFPTPASRMAYWINAYNAFVIHGVLRAYPVESVRDLKLGFGLLFFKRAVFVAGGKKYSLDDIEHGILRKQFAEPRIHFAVNCASLSCPTLRREPYAAERLEEQLEKAAREFIGKEDNVWMRGDVLFLSKIFDWYGKDFLKALERDGVANPALADYVARYLPEPLAARLREEKPRIEFYGYDWSLNDASARAD